MNINIMIAVDCNLIEVMDDYVLTEIKWFYRSEIDKQ